MQNLVCDLSLCLKNCLYELLCHMYLYKFCQLDLTGYLVLLLLVLEYMVEKKLEYTRFRNSFITELCSYLR